MKIKLLTMLYVISTFCLLSGMAPSLQNLATDIDSLANAISGKAPEQKIPTPPATKKPPTPSPVQPKQPAQQAPTGGAGELIVSGQVQTSRNNLFLNPVGISYIVPYPEKKVFGMFTIKGPSSMLINIMNYFANQTPEDIYVKAKNFRRTPNSKYSGNECYADIEDILLTEGKQSFLEIVNNLCKNQCSIKKDSQQLIGLYGPSPKLPNDPQDITLGNFSLTYEGKIITIKNSSGLG
jgi:hypothetical protein